MRQTGFTIATACTALLASIMALPVVAAPFTTAAEVKPILDATRRNWVALREYGGKDLLYFTQLEAWRCGLSEIRYAVNGGPEQPYQAEPCHTETGQPNAMTLKGHLPFVEFPPGTVQSVVVRLIYDDGTTDQAEFRRGEILMP